MNSQATTVIYLLSDPNTGETRYVGKSNSPVRRHSAHCSRAKNSRTHTDRWINGLRLLGHAPKLETLIEVPYTEWEQWERAIIKAFRMLGVPLTNHTDGGDDPPHGHSHRHTPESRAKISAARLGKKLSAETRAKLTGRKLTAEHCASLSAARIGKKFTAEHRARLSAAMTGKKHTPESRAKISAARLRAVWKNLL